MRLQTMERKAQAACDKWNSKRPVGADVIVTKDDGSEVRTITTTAAQVLCGSAVIWLRDISGCYDLERVRPA